MSWLDIGGVGRGGDVVMRGDTYWESCRLKERRHCGAWIGGRGGIVTT